MAPRISPGSTHYTQSESSPHTQGTWRRHTTDQNTNIVKVGSRVTQAPRWVDSMRPYGGIAAITNGASFLLDSWEEAPTQNVAVLAEK